MVYWLCVALLWYVILACQVADPYRLIKSNKFMFEILQVRGRRAFLTDGQQVWPLTQYFSVSFLWKIINLPGGQINDPLSGKDFSLPFLPATPSCLRLGPLKGFLSWHSALQGPSTRLVCCFQNYRKKDTIRCGGPRTPSRTTDASLDCAFVENALFYNDPWLWKVNRIELS